MKRIFYIIFIVLMLLSTSVFAEGIYEPYELKQNEVLFNESSYKIDVIDPVAATNW